MACNWHVDFTSWQVQAIHMSLLWLQRNYYTSIPMPRPDAAKNNIGDPKWYVEAEMWVNWWIGYSSTSRADQQLATRNQKRFTNQTWGGNHRTTHSEMESISLQTNHHSNPWLSYEMPWMKRTQESQDKSTQQHQTLDPILMDMGPYHLEKSQHMSACINGWKHSTPPSGTPSPSSPSLRDLIKTTSWHTECHVPNYRA